MKKGLILLSLLLALIPAGHAQAADGPDAGRVIVSFTRAAAAEEFGRSHAPLSHTTLTKIGKRALAVELPAAAVEALRRRPDVEYVEADSRMHAHVTPNDPCMSACGGISQWYLHRIGAPSAWNQSRGAGITIAILDSGIDTLHPDLAAKIAGPEINETGLSEGPGVHGTAVAGLAAAATNNAAGIAGAGWDARIRPIKVLDNTGSGNTSWAAAGIYDAVDVAGAQVINMSLGGPTPSRALSDAVAYARSRNVVVVASAGNENTSTPNFPAAIEGVISVGASTSTDARWVSSSTAGSNFGNWVDINAPGVSLITTLPGGSYGTFTGTSASAPLVSGVAALLWAQGMFTSESSIAGRIIDTSTPIGGTASRLAADAALSLLGELLPYGYFGGGIKVARGDLDGDGDPEIITGAGPGGGPHVRIFRSDGSPAGGFYAYAPQFIGGVDVAAGNVDGVPGDEIITGAGPSGGPHVRIFKQSGQDVGGFFAYGASFTGGVSVAAGNVDGTGADEIITGPASAGGPHLRVFRASGAEVNGFYAYAPSFGGGIDVASGNVDGIGADEIITGAGPSGGPHVRVLRLDGSDAGGFYAYAPSFIGGVRVTTGDVNDDGRFEIITGAGAGGGPHIRGFRPNGAELTGFFGFDPGFTGGLDVAGVAGNMTYATLTSSGVMRTVPYP